MTARLVSLNVGRPRDVAWQGKTVRTAIWKAPVTGPRMVRRINIDGDDQGDRLAHGGEHRAVFVYQLDSYRYWDARARPRRPDPGPVRRELHRRGAGRRRGLHRRPLPRRGGAVRGHPAARHLLPRRHPHGRAGDALAARRPPPARLLPARARGGRGAGGRRDREDRRRPRAADDRAGRRAPLPARQVARAARAGAARAGAQRGLEGQLPRPARPRRRRRGGTRRGRAFARCASRRSGPRARRSPRCASCPTATTRRSPRPRPAST